MDHDWPLLDVGITAAVTKLPRLQEVSVHPGLPVRTLLHPPDVKHVEALGQVEIKLKAMQVVCRVGPHQEGLLTRVVAVWGGPPICMRPKPTNLLLQHANSTCLHGRALPFPAQSIRNFDVDLWSVEGTATSIFLEGPTLCAMYGRGSPSVTQGMCRWSLSCHTAGLPCAVAQPSRPAPPDPKWLESLQTSQDELTS